MKNILGRVFAFWALVVFVSTMFIAILAAWTIGLWPEPKRSQFMQVIFTVWMKVFFTLTGVRRTFKGRAHFKKNKTYIVVCNHNSYMDPPLSSPAIPGANKTIAKSEMAKIPLFGIVYKRGSVLVNRKSEENRKQSYAQMKNVLSMGMHMCIYPEGTRNKTNEPLQKFHDGAFRLSVETGHEVIPALLFHTKKVLPHNKTFFFWPHSVEMHFLPPISPDTKSVAVLKEEVFEYMKLYYTKELAKN
ncbi:MAG: lysophospholipid acyltransferase family protein [Chitinophagaceae bacterium]